MRLVLTLLVAEGIVLAQPSEGPPLSLPPPEHKALQERVEALEAHQRALAAELERERARARELERNGFVQLEVAPAQSLTRSFTRGDALYVVHSRDQGSGSVLSAVRLGRGESGTALAKKLGQ